MPRLCVARGDIVRGQITVAPPLLVLRVRNRFVGADLVPLLRKTRHDEYGQQRVRQQENATLLFE